MTKNGNENELPLSSASCRRNAALDDQHQELLGLIERSEKGLSDNSTQGLSDFHGLLNDLFAYTNRHCDAEEALLQRHGAPGLAQHQAEHLKFRERLTGFLMEATKGIVDKTGLHQYLLEWCDHHTEETNGLREVFLTGRACGVPGEGSA